ncbi:creatininase family protein [Microbacterium sp. SORGH_AS_0888]|uniref:creatininase family protein n=1 Tax=Microbacterium sp. SORGH_AS_0888 TaxID=3041791 RepID=UPI0027822324|nr:creatininase family protein [Microbacterium sp. SORGH_AS_0888]MDQ1131265.1 creatinine amidohydrolase [Microbacterium sp. SORGH_AS_0888]
MTLLRWEHHSGPRLVEVLTEDTVLVCAVGAIEHHGAHLPLDTDTAIAEAVAEGAASRAHEAGVRVLLLPSLRYAKSDEHRWAPGTLWLSAQTLMATIRELGHAIATTSARRILFVNGHGGNVPIVQLMLRELRIDDGLLAFSTTAFAPRLVSAPHGEDAGERGLALHAGAAETSLMLFLRPESVDMASAEGTVPTHLESYRTIGLPPKPVSFGWSSDDLAANGVIGDPSAATAEYGRAIFEATVAQVAEAIGEVARFRFDDTTASATRGGRP